MPKETVEVETELSNPFAVRSEKLMTIAQLQKEIDDLETAQNKSKIKSRETSQRIHGLYAEVEDMESELSNLEEDIAYSKQVATAFDVKLADLAPAKGKILKNTKTKYKTVKRSAKKGK